MLLIVTSILLVLSTIALVAVTWYVRKSTHLQFVASVTSSFQDDWHNPRAMLMRGYLRSEEFENIFNKAIEAAYGKSISFDKISRLLDEKEREGNKQKNIQDKERLDIFEKILNKEKYPDPLDDKKSIFTALQALSEVMLSFDRLAVFRNEPMMMKKTIIKYKPPIRDLCTILQAFIAVRILLRPPDLKNYKKDYIHLLAMLDLKKELNLDLFKRCKKELIERKELKGKELRKWNKNLHQLAQSDGGIKKRSFIIYKMYLRIKMARVKKERVLTIKFVHRFFTR